jgi:hypothetical protein
MPELKLSDALQRGPTDRRDAALADVPTRYYPVERLQRGPADHRDAAPDPDRTAILPHRSLWMGLPS